jgi:transcriptional regulator with XRE-family HTH domain
MNELERVTLAERIRELRERAELSLGELGEITGISKGYLSQLERGEAANPSVEVLGKLAQGLGTQASELLGEETTTPEGRPRLPRGLEDFLQEAEARGTAIPPEDVNMLLHIRYRGKTPTTKEDWALLYDFIRRIVK